MKVTGIELLQAIKDKKVKNGSKIIEYKNDIQNQTLILDGTIQEEETHYELYNNHLFSEEYTYLILELQEVEKYISEKEIADALYMLLNCSLKDTQCETQKEQFNIIYSYIIELEKHQNVLKEFRDYLDDVNVSFTEFQLEWFKNNFLKPLLEKYQEIADKYNLGGNE